MGSHFSLPPCDVVTLGLTLDQKRIFALVSEERKTRYRQLSKIMFELLSTGRSTCIISFIKDIVNCATLAIDALVTPTGGIKRNMIVTFTSLEVG